LPFSFVSGHVHEPSLGEKFVEGHDQMDPHDLKERS
jgi:hypothetical protein